MIGNGAHDMADERKYSEKKKGGEIEPGQQSPLKICCWLPPLRDHHALSGEMRRKIPLSLSLKKKLCFSMEA